LFEQLFSLVSSSKASWLDLAVEGKTSRHERFLLVFLPCLKKEQVTLLLEKYGEESAHPAQPAQPKKKARKTTKTKKPTKPTKKSKEVVLAKSIRRLLICTDSFTSTSVKTLAKNGCRVETFNPVFCFADAVRHKGQVKARLARREEIEKVFGAADQTCLKPIFVHDIDPHVKYFGFAVDSIVRFERQTCDGLSVEFRRVKATT
jgi:hypothetical protein